MEEEKKDDKVMGAAGGLSAGDVKRRSVMSTRSLCLTAVMAAFICIMTVVPRIPIPLGYAHLGDAALWLVVLYVGRREGAIAASIGSAFADFLGGFSIWIVPTLLIKYSMAEILWRFARPDTKNWRLLSGRTFSGLLFSSLWMVFFYTIVGAVLYDSLEAGLTSTPGLLLEGGLNMIAAYGAGIVLERTGLFRNGC